MSGVSAFRSVRSDLLLALLDHVVFEVETGCWLLTAVYLEPFIDYRILTFALWYPDIDHQHVFLDEPWCANAQFGLCVNPIHSTALDIEYRRVGNVVKEALDSYSRVGVES